MLIERHRRGRHHTLRAGRQNAANWLWRLDPSGTALHQPLPLPRGTFVAPLMLAPQGLLIFGPQGSRLTLPTDYHGESAAVVGFGNAASFILDTGASPGAQISLAGFDLPGTEDGLQISFDGTEKHVPGAIDNH